MFIRCVGRWHSSNAQADLSAALNDHDLQVRMAAIAALGDLGGGESQEMLEGLLIGSSDAIRAAAVAALAQLGDKRTVLAAAKDESWRVRAEVARALRSYAADISTDEVARRLLGDSSAQVQQQVIEALAEWPTDRAGSLLLAAMDATALSTRKAAAEQLAQRWPPAAEFPPQGPTSRRAGILRHLQEQFDRQFGRAEPMPVAEPTPPVRVSLEELARVEQWMRQENVPALVNYGPGLIDVLWQLVVQRQRPLPDVIFHQVLPRHDPVFDVLNRLDSDDPFQRRRAADELAKLAGQRPLGSLALWRLGELVIAESDQLVWWSVFSAVADEGDEVLDRLTYAALSHPSPEVRRRACGHLAAHPHPRHVRVLVATLDDTSHSVLCEAVRALGAVGRIEDTRPLRHLLHHENEALRCEIAAALVRLGDPEGTAALERLSYSGDPKTLRRVIQVMGDTADQRFVPILIRLLDHAPVRHVALENLPRIMGFDAAQADEGPIPNTTRRVRLWQDWFDRQTGDNPPLVVLP